jgi:hypothetical protein
LVSSTCFELHVFISGRPFARACTNGLPDDDRVMFETCKPTKYTLFKLMF